MDADHDWNHDVHAVVAWLLMDSRSAIYSYLHDAAFHAAVERSALVMVLNGR